MNNKEFIIRLETKEDYKEVENLIRDAFWNVYRPGCFEHYLIHKLRDDKDFVKELDFVMVVNNKIIGQNIFVKTVIISNDGRKIPVLTMGPICISPDQQRKGYGKTLLDYSLECASKLGYGAVLIEGNISFYGNSGFKYSKEYNIQYNDMPINSDTSFFLCKELIPGYLKDIEGTYITPKGYSVNKNEVDIFDKEFVKKKELELPGQIFKE